MGQQTFWSFPTRPKWFRGPNSVTLITAIVISFVFGIFGQVAPVKAVEGNSLRITGLSISEITSSEASSDSNHLVQIQGTYTNFSAQTIPDLELDLVSTNAIKTRGELGELISNPSATTNLESSDYAARLSNVAPGQTRQWQISFRGENVFGSQASGVYGIGVRIDGSSESEVITTPWFFNQDIKPTEAALVIPLTTLNTHLANGGIEDLNRDLSEAKRLTELIDARLAGKVTWLQDSALSNWNKQLGAATESDIPIKLDAAISGMDPMTAFLPYGHADLGGLIRANEQGALFDAINQTQIVAGTREIIYAPLEGVANRQTISLLQQQGVRTLISNQYLRGDENITTQGVALSASNPVLVYDLAASNCLSKVNFDIDFFLASTCLRSEIGMMTAESPQRSRSVIVLAPTDFNISNQLLSELIGSLTSENWVKLTDLKTISALQPVDNYVASVNFEPTKLSKASIKQADALQAKTEIMSSLFVENNLATGFTESRVLGFSDLWPSSAQATQYLTKNLSLMNEYLNALSIQASERITTPEANSEIPLTIVNNSDQTVFLGIELTSDATSRFSAKPTDLIQVDSGQRVTVLVQITLLGAGIVSVQAQLIAPNGERFGEVENIQISSAAYSQFARTLVWIAFGLLVLLAAVNLVKRSRQGSRKESASR